MTQVTNSFSAGNTIVATDVNQNFDDLEAAIDDLDTSNLAADAGIVSTQLADRYSIFAIPVALAPYESDATWTGGQSFTLPTAATELWRQNLRNKSGRRAWICIAAVRNVAASTGANEVRITIKLGSVTLGGTYKALTNAGEDTLERTNPFDNPLIEYSDGDDLIIEVSGTGTPTVQGLNILFWCKAELIP